MENEILIKEFKCLTFVYRFDEDWWLLMKVRLKMMKKGKQGFFFYLKFR